MSEQQLRVSPLITDEELESRLQKKQEELVEIDPSNWGVPSERYSDIGVLMELREYRRLYGPLGGSSLHWNVKGKNTE